MKKRKRSTSSEKWWTAGIASTDVGLNLRITPYWESWKSRSGREDLIIDPGASFGAGDHPTTIVALELLEKTIYRLNDSEKKFSLLDVGTGTGVLTIAANVLGSAFSVGCDVDPSSIFLARRNLRLNEQIRPNRLDKETVFYVGPIEAVRSKFEIVIANLAAPVLLRLKKELVSHAGSYLILSGIPDSMFNLVRNEFLLQGVELVESVGLNDWNGLIFKA